jgi:hypothetical protein
VQYSVIPFFARVLLAGFLISLCSLALADENQRKSLQGLQTIQVKVIIDQTIELSRVVLQTDAELRLRQNRIRVADDVEQVSGRPMLTIVFDYFKSPARDIDALAETISCQLVQDVVLYRNKAGARATTWQSLAFGLTNSGALEDTARKNLAKVVDQFANDFLAVNPR